MFTSQWFRWGLWVLGIRHQRTEPGCPWQNGLVERFIGMVKRALGSEPIADKGAFVGALKDVRAWYNHARPHDHLQSSKFEVWGQVLQSYITVPPAGSSRETRPQTIPRARILAAPPRLTNRAATPGTSEPALPRAIKCMIARPDPFLHLLAAASLNNRFDHPGEHRICCGAERSVNVRDIAKEMMGEESTMN